jgi:hypothetical protein
VHLHFVVAPTRQDEVIDPITIGSPEFKQQVFELGHQAGVGLFDFGSGKSAELDRRDDSLVIREGPAGYGSSTVLLTIMRNGLIDIRLGVTPRRDQASGRAAYHANKLGLPMGAPDPAIAFPEPKRVTGQSFTNSAELANNMMTLQERRMSAG